MSNDTPGSLPGNVSAFIENKPLLSASGKIRQHIEALPTGQPFAAGDFLTYGSRATVDQTLRRMNCQGQITRVVRGIYMKQKSDGEMLSAMDVARAKAKAFCRDLLLTAGVHAIDVNATGDLEITYLATGSSSSFKYGNVRIRFKGISPSRAAKICRRDEQSRRNIGRQANVNANGSRLEIA